MIFVLSINFSHAQILMETLVRVDENLYLNEFEYVTGVGHALSLSENDILIVDRTWKHRRDADTLEAALADTKAKIIYNE